jgi:hypothetical protein
VVVIGGMDALTLLMLSNGVQGLTLEWPMSTERDFFIYNAYQATKMIFQKQTSFSMRRFYPWLMSPWGENGIYSMLQIPLVKLGIIKTDCSKAFSSIR